MPSIAPLVSAFQRRLANLPGPAVRASGEASDGEPVLVEIWVNGAWVDITSYVMVRDEQGRITITSGIRDEGSLTEQSRSTLPLNNRDSRFTRRNPTGPYYGYIGRNTPARISVPDGMGGKSYRQQAEISKWPKGWDTSGNDVWVDVNADGLLQRLSQAPPPERSILYRAHTDPLLPGLIAYWPCEDPTGSIELASAITSGSAMTWTGTPSLAAYDGFGASDPLPTLTGASLTGGVAKYDVSAVTQYQMRFLLYVPLTGFSDLDTIARLKVAEVSAGASLLDYFDIHYNNPTGGIGSFGGTGTLTIQAKDGDQASVGSNASTTMDIRGRLLRVSLENSISGTTLTSTLRVLDIDTGVTDSASATVTSTSLSRVVSMSLAPATLDSTAGLTDGAVGHLMLQNTVTSITDLSRAIQPGGEAAGRRIQRLCAEEGIAFEWIGDLDDTVLMGPQGKQNLLDLAQEAVIADGGILYETRSQLGLGYRTRTSLYNQDPALTLDYTAYNLSDIPTPIEDDRYLANRVVVSVRGVTATYEETSGPLSTELPPAGVGVYGENSQSALSLNLASTDVATLLDQAAWRVRLGTVDEDRFPQISVNLAHQSFTNNPDMKRAVLSLRLGDRIQVLNPPTWVGPEAIDQLVIGMDESITHFEHRLTFTCQPASPYSVGVLDSDDARIDTDGSELAAAVTSSATALSVTPSAGQSMLWTSDPNDWPFDIRAGGEVMTATTVGQVLNSNPAFETDLSNWTATSATLTRVSSQAHSGSWSALLTTGAGAEPRAESELVAVTAGASYRALGWLFTPATISSVGVNVNWFDSGSVYLSTSSNTSVAAAGAWVLYDTTFTAPVGAAFATVLFTVPGTPGAGLLLYADDVKLIPVSTYSASPQTVTVTRSVNGVVKAHSAGTDVRLAYPTYLAL